MQTPLTVLTSSAKDDGDNLMVKIIGNGFSRTDIVIKIYIYTNEGKGTRTEPWEPRYQHYSICLTQLLVNHFIHNSYVTDSLINLRRLPTYLTSLTFLRPCHDALH